MDWETELKLLQNEFHRKFKQPETATPRLNSFKKTGTLEQKQEFQEWATSQSEFLEGARALEEAYEGVKQI